jgi:hypothetical protein
VLQEKALKVPTNERGTYSDLADKLDVCVGTVHTLVRKENIFRVHTSVLKPLLTNKNKEDRYLFAQSKIDMGSVMLERPWQYKGMFDEVRVDEKWFNEMFKKKKMLLVTGEEEPVRKTRHKNHIPKIMFLSAQARPR